MAVLTGKGNAGTAIGSSPHCRSHPWASSLTSCYCPRVEMTGQLSRENLFLVLGGFCGPKGKIIKDRTAPPLGPCHWMPNQTAGQHAGQKITQRFGSMGICTRVSSWLLEFGNEWNGKDPRILSSTRNRFNPMPRVVHRRFHKEKRV